MSDPSSEALTEKLKGLALTKWFWIILALLLIAGMYVTASYLWNLFKGSKKE